MIPMLDLGGEESTPLPVGVSLTRVVMGLFKKYVVQRSWVSAIDSRYAALQKKVGDGYTK